MAALRMPRVGCRDRTCGREGRGWGSEGPGRGGKPQGRGFRANALCEWAGRIVQVTASGVDREELVLGQTLPLLHADPGPTAHPLVAPRKRDDRRKRHGHEMHPAADRDRRRAQHVGERQRLGTGHVVATACRLRALHRRQPRIRQVRHVDGLLQLPAATRHRHDQRHREASQPCERRKQPGQVPVAARTVDHRRPQDRPAQVGDADLVLGGQPHRLGASGKPRGHRGRRDEDGSIEPGPFRRADDAGSVPEAERCQVDQRVAARPGESAGQGGSVIKITRQRRGTARGHRPRGLGRARQCDTRVPATGRLGQHVPAEEPAPARHQQPHRVAANESRSRILRYSRASAARS
jgi:hypothetical protein